MKIYKLLYLIKENQTLIKILNPQFVRHYNKKCKIIYNNKIYPLNSEFNFSLINSSIKLNNPDNKCLFLKLVSFIEIKNINDIIEECESLNELKEKNRKIKINIGKYAKLPNFLIYQTFRLVYKVEPFQDKIKIFGNYFVNTNRDKCVFTYKNNGTQLSNTNRT